MSISMRNTKAQMYSEIERLRALLDQRDLEIADQAETIRRRDAKIEELSASTAPQPRQAPELSERRTKLDTLRTFATKFHCTARLRDGVIELHSKRRGCWVAVPEGAQP